MNPFINPVLAQSDSSGSAGGAVGALGGPMIFVIAIVFYLLVSFPLYKIAERLNVENAWFAFVPILNIVCLLQCANKPIWWIVLMLIPLINIIIIIIVYMAVSENLGHPSWMGLLMIVPLINIAVLFYWAFGAQPAARY